MVICVSFSEDRYKYNLCGKIILPVVRRGGILLSAGEAHGRCCRQSKRRLSAGGGDGAGRRGSHGIRGSSSPAACSRNTVVCGSVGGLPERADTFSHIGCHIAVDKAVHEHARRGQRPADERQEQRRYNNIVRRCLHSSVTSCSK